MGSRTLCAVLISALSAGCALNKRSAAPERHYVAVSAVASTLEPQVLSRDFALSDSSDHGWQFALGRRFAQRWRLELSYTEAGSATLRSTPPLGQLASPDVAVIYTATALNLAWQWRPHSARHNAFVRAGVAALDTYARSGSSNRSVHQVQDTQFIFGTGLEWRVAKNMRLRLAHDVYDRDASWSSLSLITDLGMPKRTSATAAVLPPAQDEVPKPKQLPETAPANAQLQCRKRELKLHFASNSHKLLADDELKLYQLIQSVDKHQRWNVSVEGHADARGSDRANVSLSERRVDTVLTNLLALSGGTDTLRMQSRAFGELEPVSSNRNPIGRARNRRVRVVFNCGE